MMTNGRGYRKNILLAGDDTEDLKLLEKKLRAAYFRNIHREFTGVEAYHYCIRKEPDLVILDTSLPDVGPLEVCRSIRRKSYVPVLMLSEKAEEIDRILAFSVGTDDFLGKPYSLKEAVAHVMAILRRQIYYENIKQQKSIFFGDFELDLERKDLFQKGELLPLTAREFHLLKFLVQNRNVVLRRDLIIQRIWDGTKEEFDASLLAHISRLRSKIEENPSKPEFIKTIKGQGYVFCDK